MTEREAIIRLEVLRIQTLRASKALSLASTPEQQADRLSDVFALHRERVGIIDGLGLGLEIIHALDAEANT